MTRRSEETLTEALRSLGLGHRPSPPNVMSGREIYDLETGELLEGYYNAEAGWALVRRLREERDGDGRADEEGT